MPTFNGLEIGLSFICGCVLLGCVAEVYYVLWWRNRRIDIDNQNSSLSSCSSTPTHLSYISCWKTPNFSRPENKAHEKQEPNMGLVHDQVFKGLKEKSLDLENQKPCLSSCYSTYNPAQISSYISCWRESNSSKPSITLKSNQDPNMSMVLDQVSNSSEEESFDLELMRLHNLHGPPRFLATINEETKEDLESLGSRNCSRTRSLSDLVAQFDTPQASPKLLNLECFQFHQNELSTLNPLSDVDIKNPRSSPPPTFKFLRDAEEKLLKRLMELEAGKMEGDNDSALVKFVTSKGGKLGIHENHQISGASKVIPLASSPC